MTTPRVLLNPILQDEGLTRGLGDPEARILVDWLVDRAELLYHRYSCAEQTRLELDRLCRRARSIARFVCLWQYAEDRAAACQLAATERFSCPLPAAAVDPTDLMHSILAHELGLV